MTKLDSNECFRCLVVDSCHVFQSYSLEHEGTGKVENLAYTMTLCDDANFCKTRSLMSNVEFELVRLSFEPLLSSQKMRNFSRKYFTKYLIPIYQMITNVYFTECKIKQSTRSICATHNLFSCVLYISWCWFFLIDIHSHLVFLIAPLRIKILKQTGLLNTQRPS